MKKIFSIIALGLLISSNAYAASCTDDLDVTTKWVEIMEGKKEILFTIKNKNDMNIVITEIGLYSKNNTIMHSEKPYGKPYDEELSKPIGDDDFYLKPFGVSKRLLIVSRLNLDVAGNGFFRCKYGRKPVATNQTNESSSSNSNSSSNSSKSKQQSETSGSSKSLLKKLLGKE